MMMLRTTLAAAAVAVAFTATPAAAAVIDFEQYAAGTSFTSPVIGLYVNGVVGEDSTGNSYLVLPDSIYGSHYVDLGFGQPVPGQPNTIYRNIVYSFDVLVDGSANAIGGSLNPSGPLYPPVASSIPIGSWTTVYTQGVSLTNRNGAASYGVNIQATRGATVKIDNIVYSLGTTVVPEPSTWGMMIVGFGLLGLTLRRRRGLVAA